MRKKVIIFDLDGTVADSWRRLLRVINRLAVELVHRELSEEEIQRLRNKKTRELFKEFKIPLIKLPFIVKRMLSELRSEIEYIKPVKGIRNVLFKLKKAEYTLGIITSNSEENVQRFLQNNRLNIFDFIYSGSSIFGKSQVVKSCLSEHGLKPSEAVYVGDETRDIEAAKKAGIQVIAVSWGFNKRKILSSQKPDFLIDDTKELLEILKII